MANHYKVSYLEMLQNGTKIQSLKLELNSRFSNSYTGSNYIYNSDFEILKVLCAHVSQFLKLNKVLYTFMAQSMKLDTL